VANLHVCMTSEHMRTVVTLKCRSLIMNGNDDTDFPHSIDLLGVHKNGTVMAVCSTIIIILRFIPHHRTKRHKTSQH
jgi:hypothetical protein